MWLTTSTADEALTGHATYDHTLAVTAVDDMYTICRYLLLRVCIAAANTGLPLPVGQPSHSRRMVPPG